MRWVALAMGAGVVGLVFACTGDDPNTGVLPSNNNDAGASDSSTTHSLDGSQQVGEDASTATDSGPSAPCDLSAPFGKPVMIKRVSTGEDDAHFRLSADQKLAVYARGDFSGNVANVYFSTPDGDGGFSSGQELPGINSDNGFNDNSPSLSPDQLELVFSTNYPIDSGPGPALWHATRSGLSQPFGNREPIRDLRRYPAYSPILNHAGTAIYFRNLTTRRIMRAQRLIGNEYAEAVQILAGEAQFVVVSGDELTIYFWREGTAKTHIARRSSTAEPTFVEGAEETNLAGTVPDWLSPDGCTIYVSGAVGDQPKTNIGVAKKPPR